MGFEINLHNLDQFSGAAIIRVTTSEEKSFTHALKGCFSAISDFFTALWPSDKTRTENRDAIVTIKESIQQTYGTRAATNFAHKFSETNASLLTVSALRTHIQQEIGPEAIIKAREGETDYDSKVAADLYENMFRLQNGEWKSHSGTGREQKDYKKQLTDYFKLRQDLFKLKKESDTLFNSFTKGMLTLSEVANSGNQGLNVRETNLPKYSAKSSSELAYFLKKK